MAKDEETVRVLRILEYVGPRSWVEKTLTSGGVPSNGQYVRREMDGKPRMYIRSAIIGDWPEILDRNDVTGITKEGP